MYNNLKEINMAQTTVLDQLEDVQFYTPTDPFHYTVDNRPLKNLDDNIRLVAAASDASSGSAGRAALASATMAYSQLGYGKIVAGNPVYQGQGMFSADYETFGFELRIKHGFLVYPVSLGGTVDYVEPNVAIHDAVTTIIPQAGRGGTLQVAYRDSTVDDRIASGNSTIQVAVITFKQGTSPGVFPLPDAGNVVLMHIDVPSDATQLLEDYITTVNLKTISQTSDLLGTSKIVYNSHVVTLPSGSRTINLSGSDIDTTSVDSIDVFVQGVNQFNWTYNSASNQILLEDTLVDSAEVRVRQSVLQLV